MFDSEYRAFAVMAAALVITPGASMAVVTGMALQRGRLAALSTVIGVNIANSSLALTSMLGLSAAFTRWPQLLRAVSFGGAVYLTGLGLRHLWRTTSLPSPVGREQPGPAGAGSSPVIRGMVTNFLNPSVILFYTLLLPQFIRSTDPFVRRFLMLAATHVSMSLLWLSAYALAVGALGERTARPRVRRAMEAVTGAILVFLGLRLLLPSPISTATVWR